MAVLPRYQKLKILLRDLSREHGLQVGDRFLSQNEIMDTYGLSFSTVTRALKELEAEGMLRRERGRGTFLAAVPHLDSGQFSTLRQLTVFLPWNEKSARHPLFRGILAKIKAAIPPACEINRVAYADTITAMDRQFLHDDREIDAALLISPPRELLPFAARLARAASVALMGAPPIPGNVSAIYTDHTAGIQMAVDHLAQLGHRHIGLLAAQEPATATENLTTGFTTAMQKHGFSAGENLITLVAPGEGRGYQALSDLFDSSTSHPLTALIIADELLAPGVIDGARMMDLKVPDDLSLLVYSDLMAPEIIPPRLTTLAAHADEMIRHTISALSASVERGERPRVCHLLPRLDDRESVASPPEP